VTGSLTRIHLRAAADEVVEVLTDAIRSGVYEVGERLPPEQELALRLGVSRPVLREALLVLRRAGVVSVRRGATGGTFVESLANIHSVIAAGSNRGDEAAPLLEARRATEPAVALLTAQRASGEQLAELERLVDALAGLLDVPEEFYEVDIRLPGSITARSASAPTEIVPLRGHMPNSFAGFVEVTATSCARLMRLACTPSA
jgi:DNA-binding FadR family transcriptional regulator